mmetsp:Transcript_4565/g.14499  ORF Transcript_4565/g.14499 Transcript_4565/m.14499 type:complete len:208 (+) Transcript_4565:1135-1758(+)
MLVVQRRAESVLETDWSVRIMKPNIGVEWPRATVARLMAAQPLDSGHHDVLVPRRARAPHGDLLAGPPVLRTEQRGLCVLRDRQLARANHRPRVLGAVRVLGHVLRTGRVGSQHRARAQRRRSRSSTQRAPAHGLHAIRAVDGLFLQMPLAKMTDSPSVRGKHCGDGRQLADSIVAGVGVGEREASAHKSRARWSARRATAMVPGGY